MCAEQVQDRLNGFIMTAAAVWCILAMVTIILQSSDAGKAVVPLWCESTTCANWLNHHMIRVFHLDECT